MLKWDKIELFTPSLWLLLRLFSSLRVVAICKAILDNVLLLVFSHLFHFFLILLPLFFSWWCHCWLSLRWQVKWSKGWQFSASGGREGNGKERKSPVSNYFGSQSSVSDNCQLVLCKLGHWQNMCTCIRILQCIPIINDIKEVNSYS